MFNITQYHRQPTPEINSRLSHWFGKYRNPSNSRGNAKGALIAIKSLNAGDTPGESETLIMAAYHNSDRLSRPSASTICAKGNTYFSFDLTFFRPWLLGG